jgi:hypothetical protein
MIAAQHDKSLTGTGLRVYCTGTAKSFTTPTQRFRVNDGSDVHEETSNVISMQAINRQHYVWEKKVAKGLFLQSCCRTSIGPPCMTGEVKM